MKRNKTIDLLRFILSILIVPIHADLFMDVSTPLYRCFSVGLVRVGVPFFFIVSGFFLKRRVESGKSARENMLRHAKLWVVFLLLDLAITGWFYYPNFENTGAFIHKALFTGLSDAYWFMPILIITQCILIPVFRRGKTYIAVLIGLVLYLFAMTHDSYSFLFEGTLLYRLSELHTKAFIFPQGGIVESVFLISLGGLFYEKREWLTTALLNKRRFLEGGIVLFCAALMAEAYITQSHGAYDGNCYLSLLVLPALLFLWAYIADPVTFDTGKLGEISLYIYLVHPIIVSIMRMIGAGSVIRTTAAIMLSLLIGCGIVAWKDRRKAGKIL